MHQFFPPLHDDIRRALDLFPRALDAVFPLSGPHRRDLPDAVEELSLRLTSDRSALHKPYWSAPRLTAAYLRYFLPWNLLRLTRLLGGLDLPDPTPCPPRPGEAPQPRLMADLGSGPLTFPLALWLARPTWRTLPLTVLCLDVAPHPLELGRKLFAAVAGTDSPWRIVLRRAPVRLFLREALSVQGVPWLLSAANVLNEGKSRPNQQGESRFFDLAEQTARWLSAPDATALFVEPGTRLGGKTLLDLREEALTQGLVPTLPCPHADACPLGSRTWCHFTFDTAGAPPWLCELSRSAHLYKEALSLSFLSLRPEGGTPRENNTTIARIISAPLLIPGLPGRARYACTARGLAVLAQSEQLPSGAAATVSWPGHPARDRKSGAWILPPNHWSAV